MVVGGAIFGFIHLQNIAKNQHLPNYLLEHQLAQNRLNITTALREVGVSYLHINNGFWYKIIDENGEEHIIFVDVNNLAYLNISDDQLTILKEKISNSDVLAKNTFTPVSNYDLPENIQLFNSLYTPGALGNTHTLIKELQIKIKKGTATYAEYFLLAQAYEQRGDYKKRDQLRIKKCKFSEALCVEMAQVIIRGAVYDNSGDPIQGAKVFALSQSKYYAVLTDVNGLYKIKIEVADLEKIRIRAQKRNFSDGIANIQIATLKRESYQAPPIILGSAIKIVTLDLKNNTITGAGNEILEDGTVIITTEQSKYIIPKGTIVRKNGEQYKGIIEVYLYEFTIETVPESLMAVDTFDQVMGYAGDLMKTLGMPYIQFFTPAGEELHVFSSNPIRLIYRIYHMQELYDDYHGLHGPVTKEDMQFLADASVGGGYPIDREFLIRTNMIRFPAW